MTILTLLGPTGAGKSTLGRALAGRLGLAFLSTGEASRALAAQNTPAGRRLKQLLGQGKYTPTATVKKIISQALRQNPQGLVLDGFPRTLAQARWFDTQIAPAAVTALLLQVNEPTLTARLIARGRSDDAFPLIRQRLADYRRKVAPVIGHYQKSNRLQKLNAAQTPDHLLAAALRLSSPTAAASAGR